MSSVPSAAPGRPDASRLPAIDALRGAAALAVVVVHLPFQWSVAATLDQSALMPALPTAVTAVSDYGRFGVHLFLIISGFCIHLRVARGGGAAGVDFVRFWQRRLTRLYPPYFFAVVASVVGLFVLFAIVGKDRSWPGMFGYGSASLVFTDMLQFLTLTQNVNDAYKRIGNSPLWTLALEEQLYILYFVLLVMRRRLGWRWTMIAIAAVTFAWRAVPLVIPDAPSSWQIVGPARWIEWALGALAVEAFFGGAKLPAWTHDPRALIASLGVAVVVNAPSVIAAARPLVVVNDAAFGLVFFILVNWASSFGARELRAPLLRILAGIGLFSYSLYLTLEPVMGLAKRLAIFLGLAEGPVQTIVMLLVRAGVVIGVAYVFYRIVEVPAIRASRKLRTPLVAPPTSAVV